MIKGVPVISVLSKKGGSGKTTTTMNLAGSYKEKGRRPLVIDLDEQQSATAWSEHKKKLPFVVVPMQYSGSGKTLRSNIERQIEIEKIDIVLIDSPPQLRNEALVGAILSDIVLVPVAASILDIWAAKEVLKTLKEARSLRDGKLPKGYLLPSKLIPNSLLAKEIFESLEVFGEQVAPPIFQRVAFAEAILEGITIDQYKPGSPGHIEFKKLREFLDKKSKVTG